MLKNYYNIDENVKIGAFFKEMNDKKNSHYITLGTIPETFVDIRTIALKTSNLGEKLKSLKSKISEINCENKFELLNFFISTGDRLIRHNDGYFDFVNAVELILNEDFDFLNNEITSLVKKEIYALNEEDTVAQARDLFLKKRINLLPVISGLKVVGEIRPIDFLVNGLFDFDNDKKSTKHSVSSVYSSSILDFVNSKPLVIDKNMTVRDACKMLVNKKVPSIIVLDDDKLYSVISYGDIFKLYLKDVDKQKYRLDFVGADSLFEDEFDLIQDYCERAIKRIQRISSYDSLKLSFKVIGEKDSGHKKKVLVKYLLSEGSRIISLEKEIIVGTNDEENNDRVNENWNIPLLVQDGLKILVEKIKKEKR